MLKVDNLKAAIVVPTDVAEFIRNARADYSGTDYPGALQLGQALAGILKSEGFLPREVRTFTARYALALEGYPDEASENIFQIMETLSHVNLAKYWG